MWGGTADRNMVSKAKGMPTSWDVKTKKNIKWVSELGSQTYGNIVVAGGVVLVGTNNEAKRDPKITGDKGVLMAFDEKTGAFLWQMVHDKLVAGRVNDWPFQGIASSPLVEGDRVYYVSNRAELMCVDLQGFRDKENDGPVTDEKAKEETHGDVVWRFDMMEEVGTLPHNLANSSPVTFGDLIYVSTSNGQDESHVNVPAPKAPAIIAVNKKTGKLVWEDASPGEKILHGQWSTPTVGKLGGVDQVIMGQGDGWVRSYEAATGKKLWEFDTNPKDSVWPKTRNEIISTPVLYEEKVYLANGQDPEHGEGVGHMYCIDPTKRGDITKTGMVWHYDKIRRSISTPAIVDGIVYQPDFSGFLHAHRREDGRADLGARHVRRRVGVAAGDRRRQALPRRRGRRRGHHADRQGEEGAGGNQHGQLRLQHARPRQRRALHRQPQPALRARRGRGRHDRRPREARRLAVSAVVRARKLRLTQRAQRSHREHRENRFEIRDLKLFSPVLCEPSVPLC